MFLILLTSGGVESAELADLQVELNGVIAWFELGVQLKMPSHDLLAIREDYRTVEKCRLEMLIRWEQLEKPTWNKLFSALVNIGMKGLADSLAEKYGNEAPHSYSTHQFNALINARACCNSIHQVCCLTIVFRFATAISCRSHSS